MQFTFSQLSPSPNLITQISFMSSQEMNGRILTCLSVIDTTTIVTSEVTLTISENYSKFMQHCQRVCWYSYVGFVCQRNSSPIHQSHGYH